MHDLINLNDYEGDAYDLALVYTNMGNMLKNVLPSGLATDAAVEGLMVSFGHALDALQVRRRP